MKDKTPVAHTVLRYLVVGIGIFTVIHLLLQYLNIYQNNEAYGNFYELTNRFDFDDEASLPTWYSQLLYLILATLAGITAYIEKKKKTSYWVWLTIAIVSVVGSIDEVSTVHETGLQGLHLLFFDENAPTFLANAWIIILPIVLVVAGIFAFKANKVLPSKTIKLFILSGSVYLFGAVGVDILTSAVIETNLFMEQGVLVAIEEVLELVGLSLAIYTSLSYLETNYSKRFIAINKHLRG